MPGFMSMELFEKSKFWKFVLYRQVRMEKMFKRCWLFEKMKDVCFNRNLTRYYWEKYKLSTYHRTLSSILLTFLGNITIIFSLRICSCWNESRTSQRHKSAPPIVVFNSVVMKIFGFIKYLEDGWWPLFITVM